MRAWKAEGGAGLSRFLRLVIAALLAYALIRGFAVRQSYEEADAARRALRSELQELREEVAALQRSLDAPPDDREIEQLARERLGLVLPDERIFYFAHATDKEG